MKRIVLAGGTGTLGQLLIKAFIAKGWDVIVLTRSKAEQDHKQVRFVYWNGETLGEWVNSLEGIDTLINLSGKSIQCRFSKRNRAEMRTSRLLPTKVLGEALTNLKCKPIRWINFSGVSIFNGLSTIQDESSKAVGNGFLAELSRDWEEMFFSHKLDGIDQVVLRVSPVLLPNSGFFSELVPLVRLGLGGQVGDGKQMMNWIHHVDFVRLLVWLIEKDKVSSIYHACTPLPVSNQAFMQSFRKEVGISMGLPLPVFMAKIGAFLKGVDSSLLLDSVPVASSFTIKEGFEFKFSHTGTAIKNLLLK